MISKKVEKPIYFYMANLLSEINKIFTWKEKGDDRMARGAYARAALIFDKIKSFNNTSANAEIDILKNILADLSNENREYKVGREQISTYFNPFVYRVFPELKQKI